MQNRKDKTKRKRTTGKRFAGSVLILKIISNLVQSCDDKKQLSMNTSGICSNHHTKNSP